MSIDFLGAPVSGGAGIARLVKQAMAGIDTDPHGQLSPAEFGSLLTNMLERVNKTASPTFPAGSAAAISPAVTAPASSKMTPGSQPFAQVPGFELSKIQDLTHVNHKYDAAVRAFSQALTPINAVNAQASLAPTSDSLATVVASVRANGFPNAAIVGSHCIDFGDGKGPIDVIRGVHTDTPAWQFLNNNS